MGSIQHKYKQFQAINGTYKLKEGDFVSVSIKNTNTTISQMIKNVLYSVTGNQSYVIAAQASGSVVTTGN